eukprot:6464354-Amphidinium_carterae.2
MDQGVCETSAPRSRQARWSVKAEHLSGWRAIIACNLVIPPKPFAEGPRASSPPSAKPLPAASVCPPPMPHNSSSKVSCFPSRFEPPLMRSSVSKMANWVACTPSMPPLSI